MIKKFKILIATFLAIIAISLMIYVFPYPRLTRSSMYLMDEALIADNGDTVRAFGTLRQQLYIYLDPASSQHQNEMKERRKYRPLTKIDRYLFGNHHPHEDDLPDTGG